MRRARDRVLVANHRARLEIVRMHASVDQLSVGSDRFGLVAGLRHLSGASPAWLEKMIQPALKPSRVDGLYILHARKSLG